MQKVPHLLKTGVNKSLATVPQINHHVQDEPASHSGAADSISSSTSSSEIPCTSSPAQLQQISPHVLAKTAHDESTSLSAAAISISQSTILPEVPFIVAPAQSQHLITSILAP